MLAPAKINLFLHVGPVDARRYHPVRSLIAFADMGDEVIYEALQSEPLIIAGPFSHGLSNGSDNLILKAVHLFCQVTGVSFRGGFKLIKNLPIASGLGGGSSDAGAALRLMRTHFAPDLSDEALARIAQAIGADGVMCLWARPCLATGYGELIEAVELEPMACVLINPMIECSTAKVYGGFDSSAVVKALGDETPPYNLALIAAQRNDLQDPAIELVPEIGQILTRLSNEPECQLARMSGSGATCFALCASLDQAHKLAAKMRPFYSQAWVVTTMLG